MRVYNLSSREVSICRRAKEAREMLGLTQQAVADRLGLPLSRVKIYENARAPLRFDLALRLCRQLIISEEYLATGGHEEQRRALKDHNIVIRSAGDDYFFHTPFLPRQCMDLASEEVYKDIPPGTPFSSAYNKFLAPVYTRLVHQHAFQPRIVFRDSDDDALFIDYFSVVLARELSMVANEALRRKEAPRVCVRRYFASLLGAEYLIFIHSQGGRLTKEQGNGFAPIRSIFRDVFGGDPETPSASDTIVSSPHSLKQ